jgi:hypothetical protein
MVLRQSTECKKTLRKAVIQRHKLNGNAVEVCLNHAIQHGLLHIKILEAIKSCRYVTFGIFIQQLIPPLQQHSSSVSTMTSMF